jgi:drug/metabolite transporter (DMT)-like permease
MTVQNLLITIACVLGISAGQILFKLAATHGSPAGGLAAMVNAWMLVALVIYGAATVLWIYVLRSTPLAVAYPLFALAFVLVPLLSALFLGEPLRVSSFVGGALIVAGVFISTQGGT